MKGIFSLVYRTKHRKVTYIKLFPGLDVDTYYGAISWAHNLRVTVPGSGSMLNFQLMSKTWILDNQNNILSRPIYIYGYITRETFGVNFGAHICYDEVPMWEFTNRKQAIIDSNPELYIRELEEDYTNIWNRTEKPINEH